MSRPRRIPLALKLAYTAFVAVMVPRYWREYGPQNFLFFCDLAVLITLAGIWTENPLLISMQAVGILLAQILWILDFVIELEGFHLLGMTHYMFDPNYSRWVRGLSLFHVWLPVLLLWLVYRLGYDRRAFWLQTILGICVLLVCYFGFDPPPGTKGSVRIAENLNFVFGPSNIAAQTIMPPLAWLAMLIAGVPVLLYLPTHLLLIKAVPRTETSPSTTDN